MRNKRNGQDDSPKLRNRSWAGEIYQGTVRRLNYACLALLVKSKPTDRWTGTKGLDALLGDWSSADPDSLERAASCPVLLLDLHFQRSEWWESVRRGSLPDSVLDGASSSAITDTRSLVQDILTEAWSIGRSTPRAANLLFGMTPAVVTTIAGLAPSDLGRIAGQITPQLRLRWLDKPIFWKNLLAAACGKDDEVLVGVHLHALQLLGSELLVGST
jgi:hypothetical protein